ncbi:MAG TPA: hypothetical protein VIM64_06425 [Puia sp.]
MNNDINKHDISATLEKSLKKVWEKLVEEKKKNNGYLVVSDKDGKVKKIPAKDL